MPYHSIFSYSTSNLFLSSSHASGVRGRPQQGQYSHGIQSFCASHVVHALGCHPKFRQATQVFLPHSVHPGHTRSICSCVGGVRAVRAISAIFIPLFFVFLYIIYLSCNCQVLFWIKYIIYYIIKLFIFTLDFIKSIIYNIYYIIIYLIYILNIPIKRKRNI